ncbi:MAG: ParB N-terminal domain-containing protein, partial [Verrucomicrobia bacterium]|nr:ParB N-terminal domain-containing protein [Verrucomicrobiota bacterium]
MAKKNHPQNPTPVPVDYVHRTNSNPRLFMREDVINGIRVQLERDRELPPWHAVVVRPRQVGGYGLLAGHHRLEAVHRANENGANIRTIPAWIREDLEEGEVDRFQVLSNLQTGLTDLELGLFLLDECPEIKSRRHYGRGRQGGLRQCARQMGMQESKVRRCREAAVVFQYLQQTGPECPRFPLELLAGNASQLAELARIPICELWPHMVRLVLEDNWRVEATRRAVRTVCRHFVPLLQECLDWKTEKRHVAIGSMISAYARGEINLQVALPLVRRYAGLLPETPLQTMPGHKSRSAGNQEHRFIIGDALGILPDMEPGSVDLVVTSPPWYKTRHVPPAPRFA